MLAYLKTRINGEVNVDNKLKETKDWQEAYNYDDVSYLLSRAVAEEKALDIRIARLKGQKADLKNVIKH